MGSLKLAVNPRLVIDVEKAPRVELTAGRAVYRAHGIGNDPISFTSSGNHPFDLPTPNGTTYLNDTVTGAVYEKIGSVLAGLGIVSRTLAASFEVSTLRPVETWLVAAVTSGIEHQTRPERERDEGQRTRPFARRVRAAGLHGVRYLTFDQRQNGMWALFRHGGPRDPRFTTGRVKTGPGACEAAGITVLKPAPFDRLTVLTPDQYRS